MIAGRIGRVLLWTLAIAISCVVLAGMAVIAHFRLNPPLPPPDRPTRLEVEARPIAAFRPREPDRTRFGKMEFWGGLVVSGPTRRFGGLSGLHVSADGDRLYAVTDRGTVMTIDVEQDPRGRLLGVGRVVAGPLIDTTGSKVAGRDASDAESVAVAVMDGRTRWFVGFEGAHRILVYDDGFDRGGAPPVGMDLPTGLPALLKNKGLEALAATGGGEAGGSMLVAIAERDPGARAADIPGFAVPLESAGPPLRFTYARTDDFDVTGLAALPNGDLLVLERRFQLFGGVSMRVRRMGHGEIVDGARIAGELIMAAAHDHEIDNMEGLDVHVSQEGDTLVTIVSDDNLSVLQRTLILRLRLATD